MMQLTLLLSTTVASASTTATIQASWNSGARAEVTTGATPTYQTSINPLYRIDGGVGSSPISNTMFNNMKLLNATNMRHVPWFPYPKLSVLELQECEWDFTLIDPITEALFDAMGSNELVLNFATTPEWVARE